MYDYLYGGGFLVPRIWTMLLDENLKHAHAAGFTDYYAEAYPNEGLDGPMLWLTARLLRNVDQSRDALLDEFYRTHYREAAGPMRRFFERCEELWMGQPGPAYWLKHYRNESQAVIFPSAECRALREILDEASDRVSGQSSWFLVHGSLPNSDRKRLNEEPGTRNQELRFEPAGTAAARRNVKLVSDAFGVTERFVAFYEARDRLSRLALRSVGDSKIPEGQNFGVVRPRDVRASGLPATDDLATALTTYLSARDEFVRYTMELRRSAPTAMRVFNFDDYLKNDPAAMALLAIVSGSQFSVLGSLGPPEWQKVTEAVRKHPAAASLWAAISSGAEPTTKNKEPTTRNQELLTNAVMTGPLQPARTIASLPYGVALPAPWQSSVEPAQYHSAELTGPEEARVLRVSGTKDTTVSQWVRVADEASGGATYQSQFSVHGSQSLGTADATKPGTAPQERGTKNQEPNSSAPPAFRQPYAARIEVRGHVSPGTAVSLVFTWLNEQQKYVGYSKMRLPDGEWPDFVTLEQAALPPKEAVWAGIGLRIQNQVKGDWIEAKGFSIVRE